MRNENYLKLRLVKEYFVDPAAVNDPQAFDFDYVVYNGNKQGAVDNDAKKVLFCVNIEQPAKEIKVKRSSQRFSEIFRSLKRSQKGLLIRCFLNYRIAWSIVSHGQRFFRIFLIK